MSEEQYWGGKRQRHDLAEYEWAIEIVAEEFARGLQRWTDGDFVSRRHAAFKDRDDPIAARFVESLPDEALGRAFVSFWTVGQTIASQSRFWLDVAIVRMLLTQQEESQRRFRLLQAPSLEGARLSVGVPLTLDALGELRSEGKLRLRQWKVAMQANCLREVDILVGEQERGKADGLRFRRTGEAIDAARLAAARACDVEQGRRIESSLTGPPLEQASLRCDLLVVEPDRRDEQIHAWAIRLVNPRLMSRPSERKDERVNVLRLLAYMPRRSRSET